MLRYFTAKGCIWCFIFSPDFLVFSSGSVTVDLIVLFRLCFRHLLPALVSFYVGLADSLNFVCVTFFVSELLFLVEA